MMEVKVKKIVSLYEYKPSAPTRVLNFILKNPSFNTGLIVITVKELCIRCDCSKPIVTETLKHLVDCGLITREINKIFVNTFYLKGTK